MTLLATVVAQVTPEAARNADEVCGERGWLCRTIFDATHHEWLAVGAQTFIVRPFRILAIVVVAFILVRFARRIVRRSVPRLMYRPVTPVTRHLVDAASSRARAGQRAETLAHVLESFVAAAVWFFASLAVLGEVGIAAGPIVASAGVAGIAIGFGAQSLVRDFLSGVFIITEDQFGVGDIVDTGRATGVVEMVSLRTTRLRAVDGTLWHVPNGELRAVGNLSQDWSRALLDVEVSYDTDLALARRVILEVAATMAKDGAWESSILDAPEVWGIESLGASGIAIRVVMKTKPAKQWEVMRELRARLKAAFDANGIEIPFPQRTVWLRAAPPEV